MTFVVMWFNISCACWLGTPISITSPKFLGVEGGRWGDDQ
jgi:hypothetical protein